MMACHHSEVAYGKYNNTQCLFCYFHTQFDVTLHFCQLQQKLYFKLYLFYNNNTRLQLGHEVIMLGGE